MPTEKRGLAFRSLATLFATGTSTGLSDAQLLERFAARDENGGAAEAAFEALVLRHGPMVFDVCRNVLGNHSHDAEDAFQAAFLILATKAGSVRRKTSVASWLYGVALRTAMRSKSDSARRRVKEQRAAESRGEAIEPTEAPLDLGILHQEVGRLPSKYRDPIILCYFEGMTHEMAAAQLRCPVATVGVRLMRAKARLKDRLDRRDELFAPGIFFTSVSGGLVRSTVRSAIQFTEAGPVSLAVAQLTKEVSKAMLLMKLKAAAAVLLVGGTVASGAGFLTHRAAADDPPAKQVEVGIETKSKPAKPKSVLEELQGTWITQTEWHWRQDNESRVDLVNEKWVISGETIRTFPRPTERQKSDLGDFEERTYLFRLGPDKTPKSIDLELPERRKLLGIYEIDGDSLKICCGIRKRPTSFLDDPKNNSVLTLKRLRRTPEEIALRFAINPGCYWVTYPTKPGADVVNKTFILLYYEMSPLIIRLAHPTNCPDGGSIYRPVAFDSDRKRYSFKILRSETSSSADDETGLDLDTYILDTDERRRQPIEYVGVELVTPEALKREKANKDDKGKEKPNPKP